MLSNKINPCPSLEARASFPQPYQTIGNIVIHVLIFGFLAVV
jgi:hypothetical protein